MKRLLPVLLLSASGFASAAGAPESALMAPAKNWSAVLFTRENYHSMTLRGAEARFVDANTITVVDLNLTIFAGDATNYVETVLLSKAATFRPKDNAAEGTNGVRVIRDDLEATGTRWTYNHLQKKISLDDRVRIVFNAGLKNFLK